MIARSMPQQTSLEEARALLGDAVLGPAEVAAVFGPLAPPPAEMAVPFGRADLEAAARARELLVLRVPHTAAAGKLTIARMIELRPEAFDPDLLRKSGYQLKSDWGILLEPLAQTETVTAGWALVSRDILRTTCNLSYNEQASRLARHAAALGLPDGALRRRTAVEAVYDTVLAFAARGERLLEKTWDWTSSITADGGYLNVGGFGPRGMQILSFSAPVRHGALGICPTREPNR